jgi:hypothetical protein
MRYFLSSEENIDSQIEWILRCDNIIISESFIICADEQLYLFFLSITGITNIKKCGLSGSVTKLKYDLNSSYETSMGINFKNQTVRICWKSKSGRIYHLHDEVDCNDIEFWLEGVDVPLVYRQLYGPSALPFKLPTTHYQLVVGSISISLELMVLLKKERTKDLDFVENELNSFIAAFNAKSEKKDRKEGIVHNWKTSANGFEVKTELDLGSAGAGFLKKLLKWLNGFEQIEKVVVGNTTETFQ